MRYASDGNDHWSHEKDHSDLRSIHRSTNSIRMHPYKQCQYSLHSHTFQVHNNLRYMCSSN